MTAPTSDRSEIRRGGADDLDDVARLCAEYCAADGHRFDRDTVVAGIGPLLAGDERGIVLLGLVDGTPEGYAVATWGWSIEAGGFEVVLDEVYVRRRGHGLGSRLIEAVEADCRRRGAKRIFLETERPNEAARRLYVRHGYVEDDSVWMSKELC